MLNTFWFQLIIEQASSTPMEEVIEYIEGGDNITLQEDFSYAGMG
jgi:hypothetical protein